MGMGIFKRRHKADQIKSTDDFEQAIAAGKPVLIDFMKYGCQPCQVMDGIVNEVSEEFLDEAIVVKANLEAVPELFGKFKVKSTPTFILIAPRGRDSTNVGVIPVSSRRTSWSAMSNEQSRLSPGRDTRD